MHPKVKKIYHDWEYFAFVQNSIVLFILHHPLNFG